MNVLPRDMSPVVDMTRRQAVGPTRAHYPSYVDLLPPCNEACPAGENIQAWLSLAQDGKFKEAWECLIQENPLPAVHGRVCYHPCESGCNRNALDDSVGIHAIERFLGDKADVEGWKLPSGAPPSGKRVLIVGAGPSGLSAAYHLTRLGHHVELRHGDLGFVAAWSKTSQKTLERIGSLDAGARFHLGLGAARFDELGALAP